MGNKPYINCDRCHQPGELRITTPGTENVLFSYCQIDWPDGWEKIDGWLLCVACKALVRTKLDRIVRRKDE